MRVKKGGKELWGTVLKGVREAQMVGIVPHGLGSGGGSPLIVDEDSDWTDIWDKLGVEKKSQTYHTTIARATMVKSNRETLAGIVSFDDQIYGSVCLGGEFTPYPLVGCDEAQDLSPINHAMIARSLGEHSKLLVIGDPLQAIYGWRGADVDSMESMRKLRKEWIDLHLTTTFRCPQVIVTRQQSHAKGFKAASTAPQGRVIVFPGKWSWENLKSFPSPIAILCRNNAPTISLAFKLIRSGVPVSILGKELGKNLQSLIKKLSASTPTPDSIETFLSRLSQWKDTEVANLTASHRAYLLEAVYDSFECIISIIDSGEVKEVDQLTGLIADLFSREGNAAILSSIHKAKGMEWETVMHLNPERIKEGGQERNLHYVVETRAKTTLIEGRVEKYEVTDQWNKNQFVEKN